MKFTLEAKIELDDNLCDINDPLEREWLWNQLANGEIELFSPEVGDMIGTVTFPRAEIEEGER